MQDDNARDNMVRDERRKGLAMTDQPENKPPPSGQAIRSWAITTAANSRMGEDYNQEGKAIYSVDKLIESAKKIEAYLKDGK